MLVAVRWDSVDFVVGRHDRLHRALFHDGLKGLQKILTDNALRVIARRHVRTRFRLAVYGEMFSGGRHMRLIDIRSHSLESLNGRKADVGDEVRIFTVGFFSSPPARIARQVEDRRKTLLCTASAYFGRHRSKHLPEQTRIPG